MVKKDIGHKGAKTQRLKELKLIIFFLVSLVYFVSHARHREPLHSARVIRP